MKSISAIQAKFLRLNVNGNSTKLWLEMSGKNRDIILENVQLLAGEIMIICFMIDSSYWWSITNFRLILYENNTAIYFHLSEIEKVSVSEVFENERTKESCTSIDLHLQNRDIKLKVEENSWYSIYNILKFAIS